MVTFYMHWRTKPQVNLQQSAGKMPLKAKQKKLSSVIWCLECLLFGPRFVGSNPDEDDGFVRSIKVCSATSFR